MKTSPRICVTLGALALLGGAATDARAQTRWQPSAADCQAAADSLRAGVPRVHTWQIVSSRACGATGIAAIAAGIQNLRLRSVSDTTYLSALYSVASVVRENSVLTEAITLAESKTAPLAARAFGLMVMLSHHMPRTDLMGSLGWGGLLAAPVGGECEFGAGVHGGYDQDLPMPADFRQRIAASADRIWDDPTDNAIMRDLAACLRTALMKAVPPAVPAASIQLVYVCDLVFRVTNSAAKEARLRYEVEGTSEARDVFVHPNASAEFITEKKGTVRLLQNGVLVGSAANEGKTCD